MRWPARLARQSGAQIITITMLGKGASMRDGVGADRCYLIVHLDGNLAGLRPLIVTDLCRPLTEGAILRDRALGAALGRTDRRARLVACTWSSLANLLDGGDDAATRSERIAALVQFVHHRQFERVAHAVAIRPGVIGCVNLLRRADFMVGLVSDSCFGAAEILRRRSFADFALAHTMQFDAEVCFDGWEPARAKVPAAVNFQ